ncbi:MAG: sulfur carrier protein ThiS adenylyltransferase ThiF [Selenomonadales bacterium]|nr:sulfur carrier protein ThiS adenylyltransferase ThiF [Selenomonadales bacterium]
MVTEKEMWDTLAARHTPEMYQRLRNARVAVAGIGGLGSHVAVMLARCGIGTLHLIDFDTVEVSNLNRQAYRVCHLGRRKVDALAEELQTIQPYCRVLTTHVRISEENAVDVLRDDTLVIEAFDDPMAKAMLVNTILTQTSDKTVIAASGLVGYASSNIIRTERVNRRLYICGDRTSDLADGLPLMAPRVMICAGHQANMAVRFILGEDV